MNNADMIIHVHPKLDPAARTALSRSLEGRIGIDCAEFSHDHPNALLVRYDADVLHGSEILEIVRLKDPMATMVGL